MIQEKIKKRPFCGRLFMPGEFLRRKPPYFLVEHYFKDCVTNPLDGRDVPVLSLSLEDRVGHCHLRVIPRDMDWAVRPPDPLP
jgi:hypothetical protein